MPQLHLEGLDRTTAWQSLEALRLGVVPSSGTIHYTVGRDAELHRIQSLLEARTGFLCVFGDYGCGKTHLLDAAEHLALRDDFAVARLAIDPTENAIQNPARVWGALAESLEFRGERGLDNFLGRFVESDPHATADGERFSRVLSPCLWALGQGDSRLAELALDHVYACGVDLDRYRWRLGIFGWTGPRAVYLPDYRTMGRLYVHLMGTVASWTRDLGGAGLLILLDEVERVEALSSENQEWALEFQRHLAAVTAAPSDLAFDPDTLYLGGHAGHREFPAVFEDDQPLIAVTSMTPLDSTVKRFGEIVRGSEYALHLGELVDEGMVVLTQRVAKIYSTAYPDFDPPSDLQRSICHMVLDARASGNTSMRSAVRQIVAHLDRARLQH